MELKFDLYPKSNRKLQKAGGRVILERSEAWSNLHFKKITLTAIGKMNWKEGPVHMVEHVLKGKGTSQVSNLGVKSSFGLLMKP